MDKRKKYKPVAGKVFIGIYCFLAAVVIICAVAVIIISCIQKSGGSAEIPSRAEEIYYGNY